MTRAKISEYSATAGDNTDVNGVDIAEGCPPSSMNNMGREIMAALKRFQVGSDGDGVTVGGSLVVSGATTLTTVSATVVQSDTVSEKTSAAGVTVDGVLLKDNGASLGGNLTFTGTGNRITGDFSDATVANRVAFQSSTTNGFTNVTAIPNGTGIACSFQACSTSDTTNCARGDIAIVDGQYFRLYTDKVGTGTALPIAFFTNAAERMRIDSSGNVSVGVSSTSARVQVDGSGATSAGNTLVVRNSAPTNLFVIRNDGYFQTGTAASSPYNATTGSGANCFINSDGGLYRSTSSLKYKQNVEDATHGLNELLLLRPVTYQGKSEADAGKTFGGLIAEEVHEAGLIEFVQYADDGSPDALAYGNMVSLCVKAIQELSAKNDALEARIAALEGAQA